MASQLLQRPCVPGANLRDGAHLKRSTFLAPPPSFPSVSSPFRRRKPEVLRARRKSEEEMEKKNLVKGAESKEAVVGHEKEEVGLVGFSSKVVHAIPGPRIGNSSMPWLLGVPLAYVGVSVVIAGVTAARKFVMAKVREKTR